MIMQQVSSSDIHSIGHENGILRIAFLSGGIYDYFNVSEAVYLEMQSSSSKGKYFHRFIKDKYVCSKIR